jgi:hypothetical protein
MKRSEVLEMLTDVYVDKGGYDEDRGGEYAEELLNKLEKIMRPKSYINPKAIEDGLDDPKWGYVNYIDMYPEHHFKFGIRPYEYYLDGWEDEVL